jgi:serine/threonine protein kinase
MTAETATAQRLAGAELEGGWRVISLVKKVGDETGGNFSFGYLVEGPNGRTGFLKALDYSRALKAPDPARALRWLTSAYNFEREVLIQCRNRRLDRVVTAITDGTCDVPDGGPLARVQYIIFERADGNARAQADTAKRFSIAWSLRALHHIATGLSQLQAQGISHQDLKPSNVLTFGKDTCKIADLGRACTRTNTAPHEEAAVAGDRSYAPPELLYRQVDHDWNRRRLGCDAYLLGSMIAFFFTGVGMTASLIGKLAPDFHFLRWSGSYTDVLPYIRHSFASVMIHVTEAITDAFRAELSSMVLQLCDPDPSLRGHPLNRQHSATQYSLERYVSRLDFLARKAEVFLTRAATT